MCDISGTLTYGCYRHPYFGVFYWTAGQPIDPGSDWASAFVWREIYAETDVHVEHRPKVSLMTYRYTNFHDRVFSRASHKDTCVNIWSLRRQKWNNYPCNRALCSICEVDIWCKPTRTVKRLSFTLKNAWWNFCIIINRWILHCLISNPNQLLSNTEHNSLWMAASFMLNCLPCWSAMLIIIFEQLMFCSLPVLCKYAVRYRYTPCPRKNKPV